MSISQEEAGRHAAQAVVKLTENDALRQEFMAVYNTGEANIREFLQTKLGMPAELAADIAGKEDQELSNYIGMLVCNYLW